MSEWIETTLGNVIELKRGYDLPQQRRSMGAVPLVSSAGVTDYHSEAMVKGPGVVTGRYGTLGQVFYIENDFWPLNTTLYVRDFKGNDPRFINYFLRSLDFQAYSDKGAVPGLNRNHLHLAEISVPSDVNEQRAIAHILGALDDKIELNRRMNETLEAIARAMFKSWFVDFDPIRAKMSGDPPESICQRFGLTLDLLALFPGRLVDSELGEVPEGWAASTLSEGFNLTMGQSPPGDTYNEDGNGLPFYQGRTDFGFRFPTRRIYCTAPTRYAKPGDTLVSVRAPVGDINMADEECCIGRGVAAVRHKSDAISFTYHAMENLSLDFALFEGEGTVFGSINKQNFENLRFVVPPKQVIAAYERLAAPLDDQIRTLEHQSRTLAILSDTLLPKLLSGELRVNDGVSINTTKGMAYG